jgi:hypothetical protein
VVDEMDQTFTVYKRDEIHTEFYLENLKGRRENLGDLDIDGKIIWTRFIWLRTIKCMEFVDQLKNYQNLKENCVLWYW